MMIERNDTENAFLPNWCWGYRRGTGGVQAPSLYYGRRTLIPDGQDAHTPDGQDARTPKRARCPYSQTGEAPVLPDGQDARAPSEFGDVVECGVELGPETAAVVFAED